MMAALTRKGHLARAELMNIATTDGRNETRTWRLPRLHTQDVVHYEIYREPLRRLRFTDIALQPDAGTHPTAEDLGEE